MAKNTDIWDVHSDIDPKFTKGITGKDYGGTSPNAHHVIWCLTDLFGPVGQGFGWRVVAENIVEFDGTHIHWCRIEFWHTDRANTFEAYGQTKMAYTTAKGFHKVDEDAPKKSLTDAITKAAAQIGIASNIFLGRWDDNKYVAQVTQEFAKRSAAPAGPTQRQKADELIAHVELSAGNKDKLQTMWEENKPFMAELPDDIYDSVKAKFAEAVNANPKADAKQAEREHDADVRDQ